MECTLSGRVFGINEPDECCSGYIRVKSTYDGATVGTIDMLALETGMRKGDFRDVLTACNNNVVCRVAKVVAEAYMGAKIMRAWKFLKAIVGP